MHFGDSEIIMVLYRNTRYTVPGHKDMILVCCIFWSLQREFIKTKNIIFEKKKTNIIFFSKILII